MPKPTKGTQLNLMRLRWLFDRVIDRLNCTLYYERHAAPGYDVCDPSEVFHIYGSLGDVRMNGTKVYRHASL